MRFPRLAALFSLVLGFLLAAPARAGLRDAGAPPDFGSSDGLDPGEDDPPDEDDEPEEEGADRDVEDSPAEEDEGEAGDVDLDAEEGLELFEDWTDAELFQRILIVPLTGETSDSAGIGDLLEGFLASALEQSPRLSVALLDEAPPVDAVDARLYYEGCPPGEELGCQFVIGELAGVDRVVSGRVTVQGTDRYRVVVTVLNVKRAELEFTYALDLAAGEEPLLPRTVELALDRLRREELLAPVRSAEERAARQRKAVEVTRTQAEKAVVGRMDLDVDAEEMARYEEERRARAKRRVTTADLQEQKGIEGKRPEWEEIGLTESQFLSYRNSGLDLDAWRRRWAGRRLMLLGSVTIGFAAGATGLRYYGGALLSDNLSTVVDSFAWQGSTGGSAPNLGASIGFGILRNLDFEASVFWTRSRVHVKLDWGSALPTDEGGWVADPNNRPPGDWSQQTLDAVGGDLMFRYSILVMPIVRPTVGLGAYWHVYPNLYNDPAVEDAEEVPAPSIPSRFQTFSRLTDAGPQVELGVALDFNRWVGLFVRMPVAFLISPDRLQTSGAHPPPVILNAPEPEPAPFGVFRLLIGVQGRVGGLPVQIKETDDVEDVEMD